MHAEPYATVFGVDFSGAREAGRAIWIARASVGRRDGRLDLLDLRSLDELTGEVQRELVLRRLVSTIAREGRALWGIDFPFGLPIELEEAGATWRQQLEFVAAREGNAADFGRWCVAACRARLGKAHVRRQTDTETRTPFDCYHYRIVHQTFHGMRDVLRPLVRGGRADVAPFVLPRDGRPLVVEACPSSTLKRLRLPHQLYKQPQAAAIDGRRRRTRLAILAGLAPLVEVPAPLRRRMLENPGGDALDAVVAAVGVHDALRRADLPTLAAHPRYPREGYVFC